MAVDLALCMPLVARVPRFADIRYLSPDYFFRVKTALGASQGVVSIRQSIRWIGEKRNCWETLLYRASVRVSVFHWVW